MRKLVGILVITALLLALVPGDVYAQTEVTGSAVGKNQPPTVDAITVYEATETSTTSAMAPLTEFAVKLDITDGNKLKDIDEVKVTIWHDNTYASAPATGDANGAAIFTWARVGDTWSLTSPSGTTWRLITTGSPTSRSAENKNTATTGSWWLHFKPGKVAKEASGTVGSQWYIHCYVVDKQAASATNEISANSMAWYGQLSNDAGNGIYFGEVEPGVTDQAIQKVNGADASSFNLIAISNGNHNFQVKSVDTWVGTEGGSLALGTDFTLKADDDGDVAGATSLTTSYGTFASEAGATFESGSELTTGMWITVPGTTVVGVETYSGTLTFEIING